MNHSQPAPIDIDDPEAEYSPPAEWLPMVYPRRGGFPADVSPVDPAAADALSRMERDEELQQWAAWDLVNDPAPGELVLSARRHLAGEQSAGGAATLCVLLTRFGDPARGSVFVDGWVARHGLAFAVEALLETSDMRRISVRVPLPENAPDGAVFWVVETTGGTQTDRPHHWTQERLVQTDDPADWEFHNVLWHMLGPLRRLLATVPDADYAAARDCASTMRANDSRRLVAACLFPTEHQWVDEVIARPDEIPHHWRALLLASTSTAAQVERIVGANGRPWWLDDEAILAAIVDGVRAGVVPALIAAVENPQHYSVSERDAIQLRVLDALSSIPTDEAFTALAERAHAKNSGPAVLRATRRYPRRVFRILAQSDSWLFDRHVREHPELAVDMSDALPARARRRVEELTATVPDATDLPAILVTPPWAVKRKPAPAPVIDGLIAPALHQMDWLPGELEELRNSRHSYSHTTWEQYRHNLRDTTPQNVNEWQAWIIFLLAPDEVARPLLTDWATTVVTEPLRVVARYELDALPLMLRVARARPGAAAPYLMPYVDLDVARLHATMLATRKNLRKPALSWLVRHAAHAAALLVPDAVGPAGAQREHAIAALRALARATSREVIIGAAETHGTATVEAVASLLDLDPLDMLPKRIPKAPSWLDISSLPPILTSDRSAALPSSAVSIVLTMCAIGTAEAPYAGLDTVTAFCDRGSLATAVWELFELWWGAGAPAKDNWVVLALGWLGDDATITRLAPLIRRWPGEGGTARAQLGLDALAAHGSARALTELDRISRKMKFKSLRSGAAERVAEVAERLGLDPEQLADRTVPDLDLTPAGTMTLDFGPRTFTVGFSETLAPYVLDEAGKRTAGLPKATANDLEALVEDAKRRFAALKREAKTVAAEQITRLNRSMATGRRWDGREFAEHILGHPLLAHLARGLLWASFDEDSRPVVVFRVAADNTLADIDDHVVALPDGPIGLIHPAHIPRTVDAWSDVFAEHAIRQPFPQLARAVHQPLRGDLDGSGLARFTGVTATPSQALRLTYRGWEPVWENPGSWGQGLRYRLGGGLSVLLGLEPGMGVGSPYDGYPDQRLMSVELRGGTLADVDDATVSELLADLAGFAS